MTARIMALGTALPRHTLQQEDAAEMAAQLCCKGTREEALLRALYKKTGIEKRQVVLLEGEAGEEAVQSFYPPRGETNSRGPSTSERMRHYLPRACALAEEACAKALAESGLLPRMITHLITVSCSGFASPGVDIHLVRALNLRPSVQRTNVGFMGCHGALNGLQVVRAIIGSNPAAKVLLCCVELCSLHLQYGWNPAWITANSLFSDGAAALVCGETQPPDRECQIAATGSCIFGETEDEMSWHIGDNGFEMHLSARVPELLQSGLRPWLEPWLADCGLALVDVRSWAIHPGGPRILSAVENALKLSGIADDSREILRTHGNMSSPTVLFVLDRLRRRGAQTPTVLLAFGPGLSAEAALII